MPRGKASIQCVEKASAFGPTALAALSLLATLKRPGAPGCLSRSGQRWRPGRSGRQAEEPSASIPFESMWPARTGPAPGTSPLNPEE